MQLHLLFSIFIILIQFIMAEVYTATDDLPQLLLIEKTLLEILKAKIDDYEDILVILRDRHKVYSKIHKQAMDDVPAYVGNPVNAFLLTKRITTDWQNLKTVTMPTVFDEDDIINDLEYNNKHCERPTDEDLAGAAVAVARLQETYKLDAKSLANGIIKNKHYNSTMNANDCFVLALQLKLKEEYSSAATWFEEALDRLEDNSLTVPRTNILGELALVYSKKRKFQEALDMTNRLLEIRSNDTVALKNKQVLEENIKTLKKEIDLKNNFTEKKSAFKSFDERIIDFDDIQNEVYKKLCRQELEPTPAAQTALRCRYITNDVPFLKIAPFKAEEASISPYIVTFHDVLYDAEIQYIISKSKKTLARAEVEDFENEKISTETVEYRISKSTWIDDEEHTCIQTINQRIEDMTKISLKSAEALQIVNYGIGGQYEPHFDFALDGDHSFDYTGNGNRIATLMFYMSDVAEGGATVFPLVNVAVWPRKGSAAFWWNLFASGGLDYRTKHAGCPVLVGSKWVSNKWIHEKYQEFRRPCPLVPDDTLSNILLPE